MPSILRPGTLARVGLCAALLSAGPSQSLSRGQTGAQRAPDAPPPGYLPPPLDPTGVTLETRQIADGVYALLANSPFADNAGFVVGAESVLVVDSHFNGRMARQILDAVRRVSDKPIRQTVLGRNPVVGDARGRCGHIG